MGNNGSNDRPTALPASSSSMSFENVSRLATGESASRLDVEAPSFHPKFARSDTTAAQAGSPSSTRQLTSDVSSSPANSSFPISESALPTCFDTSGDFPTQISHFFPLPPTNNVDPQTPQKKIIASNVPLPASANKSALPSPHTSMANAALSLQDSLDALWAPPKHVPVRLSAPVSPATANDQPLIDFSTEPMPLLPSTTYSNADSATAISSQNASFEAKSAEVSASDIAAPLRAETLTQLVARHPGLDLGPLDSQQKARPALQIITSRQASSGNIVVLGEEEIKLPPNTYADATNIASKYPELADKVLKEPLATPLTAHRILEPEEIPHVEEEPEPPQPDIPPQPVEPAMPQHTPDRPNWALAPDDPEPSPSYYVRPRRDRGDNNYNNYRPGGYEQNQNEFDATWSGRGGAGGGGDRARRNVSRRYSEQPSGYGEQEERDYQNARNGPARRGWGQEPGNSGGRDENGHDVPPHLRQDKYDQPQRLPSRPTMTHEPDSFNASAPVADEWTAASHDPWSSAEEPRKPSQSQAPAPSQSHDQSRRPAPAAQADDRASHAASVDAWGAPPDPWGAVVENHASHDQQSQAPAPSQSHYQSQRPAPAAQADDRASHAASVDAWGAPPDPWGAAGENRASHDQQSHKLDAGNKQEPPTNIRANGSPFRDKVNDPNSFRHDHSVSEDRFHANVLDVRAPSLAGVAALAASRASEVYDNRREPQRANNTNQNEESLPVEFDYFQHSDQIDWTSSGPTKATQNTFSPSQNVSTPTNTRTPTERNISAPIPRSTDQFDYAQQAEPQKTELERGSFSGTAEIPASNSFVLGSMKTDGLELPSAKVAVSRGASEWGPDQDSRHHSREERSASHGRGPGDQDYHDRGRGGRDDRAGGYGRGDQDYDDRGRGGRDDRQGGYGRGDQGYDDRGRGGRDDDCGRGGRDDDRGLGGRDDGPSGHGRGFYDDFEDRNSYASRGNAGRPGQGRNHYRDDNFGGGGRFGPRIDKTALPPHSVKDGRSALGPLPPAYAGPPRATSYGLGANFVLPPLDEY